MTLDANKYRVNVKAIKDLTIKKTPFERLNFIGELAVATGVPIIIVCCYMGEIYGFSDALDEMTQRLMRFYTVTKVYNVQNETKSVLFCKRDN